MTACTVAGPSCPDTSHGAVAEPCAHCGCARRTHHAVALTDGGTAQMCRGHHLSGGHSGMVQKCGCTDYVPRIVHCDHGRMLGPDLPDVECCCCSTFPCDRALNDRAAIFTAHVRADMEMQRYHAEQAIRYALAHGRREEVPF